MRRIANPYCLLALAGVLSVVAWGCSTDSPTAPRQEIPPTPPPAGQAYFITVTADPGGIVVGELSPTGTESTSLAAEVRLNGPGGPRPADGTTVLMTTNLGSFSSTELVREMGGTLVNGRVFATLFAGGLPVQLGIATVQVFRGDDRGEVDVPISVLEASFTTSNPENNLSVTFFNTSAGNPDRFEWDFGDGDTSTERSPHHLYPGAGTYQVRLTVSKRIAGVRVYDTSEAVPVTVGVVAPPAP